MTKKKNKLVDAIVDAIQDKKGKKVVVANFQKLDDVICKYFIICEGNTRPHVEAIAINVSDHTRETTGEKPFAVTGENNALWIAIDYGDVMVHVFQPETRSFYDLEHLWADAELSYLPDVDADPNEVF